MIALTTRRLGEITPQVHYVRYALRMASAAGISAAYLPGVLYPADMIPDWWLDKEGYRIVGSVTCVPHCLTRVGPIQGTIVIVRNSKTLMAHEHVNGG